MELKSFRTFSAEAYKGKQKPEYKKQEQEHLINIYNAANSLSLQKWLLFLEMEFAKNQLNAIGKQKWKIKCVYQSQREILVFQKGLMTTLKYSVYPRAIQSHIFLENGKSHIKEDRYLPNEYQTG